MIGYVGFLVLICLAGTSFAKLPTGITGCSLSLNTNEFNQCVIDRVGEMTPYLKKGSKDVNLPALDPFFIPVLSIDRSLDSLVIKTNLTNITTIGASNYTINRMNVDPRKLTLKMELGLPLLRVRGTYDIKGRLLLLVLNGIGTFNGVFSNITAGVNARGKEVVKDGIKRIEVDKIQLKIFIGNGKIKLNSPPEHAITANAAQAFFNGNPRTVLDIANPIIEDTAVTISRALAARALATLTKDEIILP